MVEAPLVKPVVDHPPVFSFIPGSVNLIGSENWEEIPSRKVIRLPMVFIGVLNIVLLYFVANKLFSRAWSLVAIGIYATAPIYVFGSRLVVAENLLTTLSLVLTLAVFAWFSSKNNKKIQVAIIVVCVLAILTKISGVVLPLSVILYGLVSKNRELVRVGVYGVLAGLTLLVAYMSIFNLPLFFEVQLAQTGRELGLSTFYNRFFIHQTVAQLVFYDGWIITGLFAFFYVLATANLKNTVRNGKWIFILLYTLLSIGFILISSGEFTSHGWYSYAIFPFLVIVTTYLFKEAYKNNLLLVGFIWLLLVVNIKNLFIQIGLHSIDNLLIRAIYLIGFIPFAIQLIGGEKLSKYLLFGLALLILMTNIAVIISSDEIRFSERHDIFTTILASEMWRSHLA